MAWFIDMPFTMFYIMHSLPTNQYKGFFTMMSGMRGMRPKEQKHSAYYRRVHFTPLWYPDGTYTAYTCLEDAWTPAGMLSANLTDYVKIKGNVYDDWHVGRR